MWVASLTDEPFSLRLRRAREDKKLTQAAVAQTLRVSQSAVAQWELGRSYPSPGTASKIEKLLGVQYRPTEREYESATRDVLKRRPRLPIVGSPSPGDDERIVLDTDPHGEILAPPQLENVKGAKAVYVRGRSMEPRYYPGEVVYLHPNRRPNPGDFVFVTVKEPAFAAPVGYIRQFTGEDLVSIRVHTLNPNNEEIIARQNLVDMAVIVGSGLF
jgi:phage repressor protein C with HTH and peptisase S24 domain